MRRAALVALLGLAASACTIDVDIGIALDRSGSGSVSVSIEADQEFHDLFELTGRDFEDLVATRGSEAGLSFAVENGPTSRYTAQTNTVSASTVEDILEGLAPGIGSIAITAEETGVEIDGLLNPLTSLSDIAVYFENSDPAQFADDVAVNITVTMPGDLETSTATSRQGDQLTWALPFSDSGTRLLARSVLEKERSAIPWTAIIVGAIVLLAAVFLVSVRSRLAETGTASPMRVATSPPQPATPPEDQAVAPEATPPEDQPVAPPDQSLDP